MIFLTTSDSQLFKLRTFMKLQLFVLSFAPTFLGSKLLKSGNIVSNNATFYVDKSALRVA